MGMDVYGNNKESEKGKYFRNSCWWWRPLWTYCEQVCPEQTSKVECGQSNDGDGLKTQEDCNALAKALRKAVEDKVEYNEPEDLAKVDEQGKMYPFDYQNVLEFAEFLENCDGFEIW